MKRFFFLVCRTGGKDLGSFFGLAMSGSNTLKVKTRKMPEIPRSQRRGAGTAARRLLDSDSESSARPALPSFSPPQPPSAYQSDDSDFPPPPPVAITQPRRVAPKRRPPSVPVRESDPPPPPPLEEDDDVLTPLVTPIGSRTNSGARHPHRGVVPLPDPSSSMEDRALALLHDNDEFLDSLHEDDDVQFEMVVDDDEDPIRRRQSTRVAVVVNPLLSPRDREMVRTHGLTEALETRSAAPSAAAPPPPRDENARTRITSKLEKFEARVSPLPATGPMDLSGTKPQQRSVMERYVEQMRERNSMLEAEVKELQIRLRATQGELSGFVEQSQGGAGALGRELELVRRDNAKLRRELEEAVRATQLAYDEARRSSDPRSYLLSSSSGVLDDTPVSPVRVSIGHRVMSTRLSDDRGSLDRALEAMKVDMQKQKEMYECEIQHLKELVASPPAVAAPLLAAPPVAAPSIPAPAIPAPSIPAPSMPAPGVPAPPIAAPGISVPAPVPVVKTPRKKLRVLHWDKLQAEAQGTVWDECAKVKVPVSAEVMDTLFLDKKKKVKTAPKTGAVPDKIMLVADDRIVMAFNMLLGKLRRPAEELLEATLALNEQVIGGTAVEQILKNLPDEDTLEAVAAFDGDPAGLSKTDRFLWCVSSVPQLETRFRLWAYMITFIDEYEYRVAELEAVEHAVHVLATDPRLRVLLARVLGYGNYLNQGHRTGEAKGFRLAATLPKVALLKTYATDASQPKNLLEFLVDRLADEDPGCLAFTETEEVFRAGTRGRSPCTPKLTNCVCV